MKKVLLDTLKNVSLSGKKLSLEEIKNINVLAKTSRDKRVYEREANKNIDYEDLLINSFAIYSDKRSFLQSIREFSFFIEDAINGVTSKLRIENEKACSRTLFIQMLLLIKKAEEEKENIKKLLYLTKALNFTKYAIKSYSMYLKPDAFPKSYDKALFLDLKKLL